MSTAPPKATLVIVTLVLGVGSVVLWRAAHRASEGTRAAPSKPVTVTAAKGSTFRPTRTYVGTLDPWVEASVGPQLVSAYVDTVLVRPGAAVKRGEVLATLDCRTAGAAQQAVVGQARAIDARQRALADESARTQGLLDGGFVSPNEAEQKSAQSAAQAAELEAAKAGLSKATLEVNDCVLRAPFDGEIARRMVDPGAFVRPGTALVTVVDRSTVRVTADAPEVDFDVVTPGTLVLVKVFATGKMLSATVARRAPAADPATRTVHFEIDVPDKERVIPVGTTAEIDIDVGDPLPAIEVPAYAVTEREAEAFLFVVEGDVVRARAIAVLGESGGRVFLAPGKGVAAGAVVVTEGRALLEDGDKVSAKKKEAE
jgi:RND family efflux transporter MFP subunit